MNFIIIAKHAVWSHWYQGMQRKIDNLLNQIPTKILTSFAGNHEYRYSK